MDVILFLLVLKVQLAFSLDLKEFVPFKHDIIRVRNESHLRALEDLNQYAVLDFIGLVERHGYTAEEHKVTTSDGYNLVLHRITGGPSSPLAKEGGPSKPVVFAQHGLSLSSDSFVLIGPGKDLAFLLVDAGYDVWLGNARGNTYSRSHISLSPEDKQFWEYSYHEIGLIDLSTSIDYALITSKQKNLTFIGYSMGAPELLVLLSESPEYNQKVKLAVLLAPIVIWKHKLQPIMKMYNHLRKFIHKMVTEQNYYEWLPQSSFAGEFAKNHCKNNMYPELSLCSNLLRIVADITTFNTSAIPTIFAHFPAGISYQSVEHYWQNIDTREFQAYNYGTRINQNLYFSSNPPVYDLSQVTAPVALFFGHKDFFATSKDVEILRQRLPNVVLFKEVLYKKFNHLDFLWSQYVKTLLYDDVISLANEYRN